MRHHLVAALDWRHERSVLDAIQNLKHDEHIHAATATGILNFAFVIQLQNSMGAWLEERRIFEVPYSCANGCNKRPHDDACYRAQCDQLLESIYLDDQLDRLSRKARTLGIEALEPGSYVLDIDLDFFHTQRAGHPHDPSVFYRLIKGASAITIAKEPACVDLLKFKGEMITSETLLRDILSHIETA